MELTIRLPWFEMCVRTKRMYVHSVSNFCCPMIAIRCGSTVWSTGKGFRKLGAT